MCAAVHGWVGLGKIIYLSSGQQLSEWMNEMNAPPAPVRMLAIHDIAPVVKVVGPVPQLVDDIKELHRRYYEGMITIVLQPVPLKTGSSVSNSSIVRLVNMIN